MKSDYRWCEFTFSDLPPRQAKRVPKWARRALLYQNRVYVPAIMAGSEMMVFLCAGYDGTTAVVDGRHAYYPADWIAREFPDAREAAERAEQRVREFFGGQEEC